MSDLCDFVLTGTGVYGPQRPGESDIDIMLHKEDAAELLQDLKAHNMTVVRLDNPGYPDACFYFRVGGLKLNILQASGQIEFDWWKNKTERMKKIDPIEDRAERLRVFNGEEATNETK